MKWDIKDNELPMWVADMDFQTVPAVTDAIQKRAKQGILRTILERAGTTPVQNTRLSGAIVRLCLLFHHPQYAAL